MSTLEKLRAMLRENTDGHLSLHECTVLQEAIEKIQVANCSATEFFVVMQKRADGIIYPDLHKTDHQIHLTEEDVDKALKEKDFLEHHFHKVRMVGIVATDWDKTNT